MRVRALALDLDREDTEEEHLDGGAPAAYQKGPEMPKFHATFDDWRRVAAHVHCETITEPVRPILTLRPAVLKCSEPLVRAPTTFCSSQVSPTVKIVKKTPKPSTMA